MNLDQYNAELGAIKNKMNNTSQRFVNSFNDKAKKNKNERQQRENIMKKMIESGDNDVELLLVALKVSRKTLLRYIKNKKYIVVSGKVVRE